MNYFLDTDLCIDFLKGNKPSLIERIQMFSPEHIKIPSIVKAELLLGVLKSQNPNRIQTIEDFLAPFEIVPFCDRCTNAYAHIRLELENRGQLIGANDLLIASVVIVHQGTLVTNNIKEFQRIPELKLQNWTKDSIKEK